MAAPDKSRTSAHRSSARFVFAVLACAIVVFGQAGCRTSSAASTSSDQDAAQRVGEYFAGVGAHWVEGLAVKDIRVTNESRGRTLSLTFLSDGSAQGSDSLLGLYYASISEHGWTAELNKTGLGLLWVRMEFDYHDGSAPETLEVDIAGHGVAGSTRIRAGGPTTSP
jgi:hypothetical protein